MMLYLTLQDVLKENQLTFQKLTDNRSPTMAATPQTTHAKATRLPGEDNFGGHEASCTAKITHYVASARSTTTNFLQSRGGVIVASKSQYIVG